MSSFFFVPSTTTTTTNSETFLKQGADSHATEKKTVAFDNSEYNQDG